MTAKEMFDKLGYTRECGHGIYGHTEWFTDKNGDIIFFIDTKEISIGETIVVDVPLLKAIVQKAHELGWM